MPGHKIPDPYAWNETFRVFYDNLDVEHQGLFEGIFALVQNPGDSSALSALKTNVEVHFANEEAKMKDAKNYTEFSQHKPLHEDFLKKLRALSTPLSKDQLDFAKEWLVNHIKDTDFGYKTKL